MAGARSQPVTYSCLLCALRCDAVHLDAAQLVPVGLFELARLPALFQRA